MDYRRILAAPTPLDTPLGGEMATLQKVQIFPAIGIARIGNSPEWYLGPELPFPAPAPVPPGGSYKDDRCRIKRQAQRFRLWGFFSDGTDRELTQADGDITWTVHLANTKPAVEFNESIIDGGLQTLNGPAASATFTGTFKYTPPGQTEHSVQVPLGEAQTDGEGRLLVVGGFGTSANPSDPNSTPNFPRTQGWYDDVSDGPITAQITVSGTTFTAENGAWVICPPPRFAPTTYSVLTLYDTLRKLAIGNGQLPAPGQPSFANDIYPILQRALDMRWVTAFTFNPGDHDTLADFAPPGGPNDTLPNRQAVYARLAPGQAQQGQDPPNMPLLSGGAQLLDFQHTFMQQWSQGTVTPDWPPTLPTTLNPDGLTRAALEACVGGAFFPGIEAGGIPAGTAQSILTLAFVEAFRLDQSQVHPGDVTQAMARPWQGDFMLCSGPESQVPSTTAPANVPTSWWPAARPSGVYPFDDPTNKRLWTAGIATSMSQMAENWHQLGFIVDPGTGQAVEVEKTNVCKSCFFINDRPEISKDEAQALIDSHESIADGLYVVIQGLTPNDLGITTGTPSSPQITAWAPQITNPVPTTMTITATDLQLEDNTQLGQTQRITFGYQIAFKSTDAFTQEDVPETIGASVAGLSATTVIDLTTRQHPYMDAGPTTWLNADTRVFQRQPNGGFANQTLHTDPNGFIADVIDSMRGVPAAQANAWFESLTADEQGSQLEWSQTIGNQPAYNFAICRVRYRAELSDAGPVRVFFRLFPAMTTSTDFLPATTYFTGGQPGTKIPVLGVVAGETTTIPFFAAQRGPVNASLNTQQDPKNIDTLKASPSGQETYSFFGCYLDINQPGDQRFPINPASPSGPFSGPGLLSIAELIRGTHQCLVAEINFDPDPIPVGSTTANCDRLAQRNLSIDHSDNPGAPDTHRVQHTFTIRPTTANPAPAQGPDELMIDWGNTPPGTVATLYLPGVNAVEVMALADRLYSHNRLTLADTSSVQIQVTGGVSYVPIPTGGHGDLAGLLTLDLPSTVRRGQLFRVVIHQVIDTPPARPHVTVPPPPPAALATPPSKRATEQRPIPAAVERTPHPARHILGSFQFSVKVQTAAEVLPIVERAQTNIQRALDAIPIENRWYPVILRYLSQVSAKVAGLGGHHHRHPGDHDHDNDDDRIWLTGKVDGIRYDAFGDFDGFLLRTPEHVHEFSTRDTELEHRVTRAWRDRITIRVAARADARHVPTAITFLQPPRER
jgi:hypothetical protein